MTKHRQATAELTAVLESKRQQERHKSKVWAYTVRHIYKPVCTCALRHFCLRNALRVHLFSVLSFSSSYASHFCKCAFLFVHTHVYFYSCTQMWKQADTAPKREKGKKMDAAWAMAYTVMA